MPVSVPKPEAEDPSPPVAAMAEAAPDPGFGVYVHWPFCLAKCPYCDFNSHVRAAVDQERWRAALLREIDHAADQAPGRHVGSIFFGGGTPSLMPPATVAAVIERVAARWTLARDAEITLEANPTSAEAARFAGYAAAGVNRFSLGVQALDDAALRLLGRRHDVAEARRALALARAHAARFSFDLIYARPGQTLAAWAAELRAALELAGDHLSLYQLTIEPGTAFHRLHTRGRLVPPAEDHAAALYETTQEICAAAGLPAYEISNHAVPGAESRHNLTYWRYGEYAGIGPGAHGRLRIAGVLHATAALRAPEAWLAAVEAKGHGLEDCVPVPGPEQGAEMLMMGLRLSEGVSLARHAALGGASPDEGALARLIADGLLARSGDRLRATASGRLVLNSVLAELLA